MELQTKIDMNFNYEPIPYCTFKTTEEKIANGRMGGAIRQRLPGEKVEDVMYRLFGVRSGITHRIAESNDVYPTQTAGHGDIWTESGNHPSTMDVLHASTFPEDYDLMGQSVEYICGMSVPPIMVKRLVAKLLEQRLLKTK